MDSRAVEHLKSQTLDIARRSTVAKRSGPAPIHGGMASQTRGASLGGPTQGTPPDASSPLPTSPSREGKAFPVPAVAFGMKGSHDPNLAHAIDPLLAALTGAKEEASEAGDDGKLKARVAAAYKNREGPFRFNLITMEDVASHVRASADTAVWLMDR